MLNKINISPDRQRLIVYIALAVVTLAVFWQVNKFDFINFDDNIYVSENSIVQSGLTRQGFFWAFSTRYFNLWTPLVWLSFMLDNQLYGLNAGGYHLTNLILHIMSALLLFWLFNRMTGAIWKSAFVAAFFALHPLHVESVAWVAERKDVLSAFFWMLTLCLYVYYTEKPITKRYLLVLFGFILAILSKPMVITLPIIMILLDYWPLKRFETQKDNFILWQLKEKLPFFVLSIILVIITLYTLNEQEASIKGFPFYSRLTNSPVAFVTYLVKTFWPHDLAIFYPFSEHLPLLQVLGATILIIIISAGVIIMAISLPYLFVGWLWFAITILPIIGIIDNGANFSMTDRYHYLPSIGITIMLAWGIPYLFPSADTRKKILFPAAITFLAILIFLSWKQCSYWRNNSDLWNHALNVTKENYMAHGNLASVLLEKGKTGEAIYHYNKAISITPDYDVAYYNLGIAYYSLGRKQRAIEDFKEAIRISPNYAAAYYNMGIIYLDLGQYQNAIENYSKAIRINPYYANAYNDRALAYLNQGNKELGCPDAQKACALGVCKILEWAKKSKGLCL